MAQQCLKKLPILVQSLLLQFWIIFKMVFQQLWFMFGMHKYFFYNGIYTWFWRGILLNKKPIRLFSSREFLKGGTLLYANYPTKQFQKYGNSFICQTSLSFCSPCFGRFKKNWISILVWRTKLEQGAEFGNWGNKRFPVLKQLQIHCCVESLQLADWKTVSIISLKMRNLVFEIVTMQHLKR